MLPSRLPPPGSVPRAPLILGVTGHRDLRPEDLPRLERLVREVLEEIRSKARHTPLLLLSPLADGADRLVARVALQEGHRLIAILPMEQSLYETDFDDPADFRKLLSQAEATVVLPSAENSTRDEVQKAGSEARNIQYALAGAYIARHSRILIALWDGLKSDQWGGTAQVVSFQQRGRFDDEALQQHVQSLREPFGPGDDPLDAPERGMVVQIVTPRQDQPEPAHAFETIWYAQDGRQSRPDASFNATHELLDELNQDLVRLWPHITRSRKKKKPPLLPEEEARRLPRPLQRLREQYAAADALALYFQACTWRAVRWVGALVFFAAIWFAHHSTLAPEPARKNPWSLALYLISLGLAGLTYYKAHGRKLLNKYLDYRAVAEGLRVQFFWWLSGVEKSVSDHYLRWQESELEWIRLVPRSWSCHLSSSSRGVLPAHADDLIQTHWVKDQTEFFQDRAPKKRRHLLKLTARRDTLLLASVGICLFEVFSHPTGRWLQRAVGLLGAVIAIYIGRSLIGIWRNLWNPPRSDKAFGSFVLGVLQALVILAVLGGALWSLYALLIGELQLNKMRYLEEAADSWRMVAIGLAAVAAALIYGNAEVMALSDESKQYERMERMFTAASHALTTSARGARRTRLIEELGKAALAENGEWVLMHRERPIELPI